MAGAGNATLFVSSAGFDTHGMRWWHVTPADWWLLCPPEMDATDVLVRAYNVLHDNGEI